MGHGRTGAIERAAGSASARSFLLTPELVAALNDHGKVDIPDLNYHLAHVALLQAAAESYGLLNGGGMTDAVPDGGNSDEPGRTKVEFAPLQLDRFGDWCRSLGLDAETVSYASGVAARLEDPETESGAAARLIEAGERLDSEGTGLDLDDDKVDAAMREQVEKLKASRTDGLGGGGGSADAARGAACAGRHAARPARQTGEIYHQRGDIEEIRQSNGRKP